MSWLSRVAALWSRRQPAADAPEAADAAGEAPFAEPPAPGEPGPWERESAPGPRPASTADFEAMFAEDAPDVLAEATAGVLRPCDAVEEMLEDVIERAGDDVGLRGYLDEIGVEQLVEMVRTNHRSGRLWVRTPTELFDFQLHQGRIARIQVLGSSATADRLGEAIVQLGFAAQDVIDRFLADGPSKPLGVRLVDSGVLTTDQLREALSVQTVARLMRAMEAGRGAYAFKRSSWDLGGPPGGVDVDPFTLLDEIRDDDAT